MIKLNSVPKLEHWSNPKWSSYLDSMCLEHTFNRRRWEWAQVAYGLDQLGVIHRNSTGLGIGVGNEPLIFYFANHCGMVVATDMYIDNWAKDGLANPSMLTEQHKFSPIPFPKERLRVLKMDALNLEFPSNHFDFTWSVGSIEHFGSSRYRHALWIALRKSGLRDWASKFAHIGAVKAVKEMARVLKPGGIAAITTEVILNGCPHHEFFLPNEILQFIITPSGMELIDNEIEYHPSNYFMENILPKNMWDSTEMPQVVLRDQRGTEFTSISLFLRKKGL